MWMNKNTHSNIIFEKEDYREFIYPPAENRKTRNTDLVLFAFWPHIHTHEREPGENIRKKAQLNRLCVLDLPTADDTFPGPLVSISDLPGLDSQIKFTPSIAKCASLSFSEPQTLPE